MTRVNVIALLTDFGLQDGYVGILKGVITCTNPHLTIIDISHKIPPQNIAAGRFCLMNAYSSFPNGTVYVAVIDPGVGSQRRGIAIQCSQGYLVGPDNGLFGWLADCAEETVALDPGQIESGTTSATFHGRDLMAPVAAKLVLGAELSDLGQPHEALCKLPPLSAPIVTKGRIEGKIVEIDHYGNLITNIEQALLVEAPRDEQICIECGEHETFGLQVTYGDQPPFTFVALIGSGGYLELALVNDNAAKMLSASVGDSVILSWFTANDRE